MFATPNDHPLNFYRYELAGAVELLSTYVKRVERQVGEAIEAYKENRETIVVDEHLGDEAARTVEVHEGLDDGTWHFPAVFEIYFPNLERRSALITLYSFFEHELEKLCERMRSHENAKVRLGDMAHSGIKRSVAYLGKVMELDTKTGTEIWQRIQDIRRIRNLVVHADGKLVDDEGRRKQNEDEIVARCALLAAGGDDEVLLLEGYLAHVLSAIDGYFKLLDRELQVKYGA